MARTPYVALTSAERGAYSNRAYASTRISQGLYLQMADDGRQLFLIVQRQDGAHYGLDPELFPESFTYWTWGRIADTDLDVIERRTSGEPDAFAYELRRHVDENGWFLTKRDAIAAALSCAKAPTSARPGPTPEQVRRLKLIQEQGLGIGAALISRAGGFDEA